MFSSIVFNEFWLLYKNYFYKSAYFNRVLVWLNKCFKWDLFYLIFNCVSFVFYYIFVISLDLKKKGKKISKIALSIIIIY